MKKTLKILLFSLLLVVAVGFSFACSKKEDDAVSFTVTIDNKLSAEDVTMNVRYLVVEDGVPTPFNVESGKKYSCRYCDADCSNVCRRHQPHRPY